jgi:hypothetical protein
MHSRIFELHTEEVRPDDITDAPESLYEDAQHICGADYVDEDKDFRGSLERVLEYLTGDSDIDTLKFCMLLHQKKVGQKVVYEVKSIDRWIELFQEVYQHKIEEARGHLAKLKKLLEKGEPVNMACYQAANAVYEKYGYQYVIDGSWCNEPDLYDTLLVCKRDGTRLFFVKSWDYHF